ncbi:Protein CBG19510 [Caenorhabditis briggsae]|uniref:Protein CBG19510 n=1 Tax=Caenorhabditis briggsae TaxID=6238 RepID=A8XVS4_CAEBR|nr:Protein CBG19510 [Caenorhabditis briggsae]CAP36743.2 Protein CBG19510 [Caenorhabditis briggsae]
MRIFKTGQCEFEGHPEKIAWERIINDYLDDNGNLEVNVRVKILGMNEEKSRKVLRSFEDKQFSDVALVIDEQKFHVSKLFLSSQSPYFANLFSRNSGKSEIKLSTSNPQNLQFFLELLYGEPGPDEETVEGILSIADMYNTPTIIKKCEEYLLEKSYKPLKEKLQMAGKYKLEELRKRCMTRIQSVSDVKSVAVEDPVEMDHDLLADLFQKILSLMPKVIHTIMEKPIEYAILLAVTCSIFVGVCRVNSSSTVREIIRRRPIFESDTEEESEDEEGAVDAN